MIQQKLQTTFWSSIQIHLALGLFNPLFQLFEEMCLVRMTRCLPSDVDADLCNKQPKHRPRLVPILWMRCLCMWWPSEKYKSDFNPYCTDPTNATGARLRSPAFLWQQLPPNFLHLLSSLIRVASCKHSVTVTWCNVEILLPRPGLTWSSHRSPQPPPQPAQWIPPPFVPLLCFARPKPWTRISQAERRIAANATVSNLGFLASSNTSIRACETSSALCSQVCGVNSQTHCTTQ